MKSVVIKATKDYPRLDVFIVKNIDDLSRSQVKKYIEQGKITVNDLNAKANQKVFTGDIVKVEIIESNLEIMAENIPLDILYEDEHLLVVNKPKGMVVHPAPGNESGTLVNALLAHCKGALSSVNDSNRPGIVHRIDKDTSGILLVAKTNLAHEYFVECFKNHSIVRIYYAIVEGTIRENTGKVDAPIGRHPTKRKNMAVNTKNGKPAITHFEVLKRFKGYTYIKARLETGRTHQIRVHMAYIGHPILGDSVYGRKKQSLVNDGQVLHAGVLGFVHPVSGEYMEFSCQGPKGFKNLLETL